MLTGNDLLLAVKAMSKTQTEMTDTENMLTYALMFTDNGCLVDGEEYVNLDEVRDIAFEISAETNRRVGICEYFGVSENVIETVSA